MIYITTEEEHSISLPVEIGNMSQLFNDLLSNYDMTQNTGEIMKEMHTNDLELLQLFCEQCNYTPITFDKPLWKHSINNHLNKLTESTKAFYNQLTCEMIIQYLKISDFYLVSSLEEILCLKLYNILTSNDDKAINGYFNITIDNIMEKTSLSSLELKIHEEYRKYWRVDNINDYTDDQINEYCERFY